MLNKSTENIFPLCEKALNNSGFLYIYEVLLL